MANNLRGEVEIQVSGKKLVFRLGVNELLSAQNDFGLAGKDEEFALKLDNALGLADKRILLYHGLRRAQPEITIDEVGDIMTELGLTRCMRVLDEGLYWAKPEREPVDPKKGGKPRPSGGPTSS